MSLYHPKRGCYSAGRLSRESVSDDAVADAERDIIATNDQLLRCPICRQEGSRAAEAWLCGGCGRRYPVFAGDIIDFRVLPRRGDLGFAHTGAVREEQEIIARLIDLFPSASFADLVEEYFASFGGNDAILLAEKTAILDTRAYGDEMLFQVSSLVPPNLGSDSTGWAIDVGCGVGGIACALAGVYPRVVGVDADPARLIIAKKLAEEQGTDTILWLCCFGERLPFPPEQFTLITAVQVVEHVTSQPAFVRELRRVLGAGGYLYLAAPNRFSLTKEPHVSVWGVGYLPRAWQDRFVRWRAGVPYTGKRNPSLWELRSLFQARFGGRWAFVRPRRRVYTPRARLASAALGLPVVRSLIRLVIANYEVLAWKDMGAAPGSGD